MCGRAAEIPKYMPSTREGNNTKHKEGHKRVSAPTSYDSSRSHDDVMRVLSAKMRSSADALRASGHVGDSTQLADLILKLALAAKAVGDLKE